MNSKESETSAKDRSRGISADMSPEAISKRLDVMDELSELAFFLAKGRPAGRVSESEPAAYGAKEACRDD